MGTPSTDSVSAGALPTTPSGSSTSRPSTRGSGDRRRRRRSTKSSDSDSYAVGNLDDILKPLVDTFELSLPTGLIYDERMLRHRDESGKYNVECPDRVSSIYDKFCEYGLVDRCDVIEGRSATAEEVSTFHDNVLVEKMEALKVATENEDECKKREVMRELTDTHDGVYFNDATWEAAKLAAGACIDSVEKVGGNTVGIRSVF